jgi:adenylate kinase family enzyme
MTTALGSRVVIIGASGSGKSRLAKALAVRLGCEAIDLDRVHWQDGVGSKRDEGETRAIVAACAAQPRWIIEGVFGWLAEVALPSATSLIWLDLPWSVCREHLERRGRWPGATADQHADFLAWAAAYWQRKTPSSFEGHRALFDRFEGARWRLESRADIARFIENSVQV